MESMQVKTYAKMEQFNIWDFLRARGEKKSSCAEYEAWKQKNGIRMTLKDIDKAVKGQLKKVQGKHRVMYDRVEDGTVWLKDLFPKALVRKDGNTLDYMEIGNMAFIAYQEALREGKVAMMKPTYESRA